MKTGDHAAFRTPSWFRNNSRRFQKPLARNEKHYRKTDKHGQKLDR